MSMLKRPRQSSNTNECVEESSRIPSTNESFLSVSNVRQQVPPPTNTPTPNGQRVDLNNLPSDPADRPHITTYHPSDRDDVRRQYLLQKPCQPKKHKFPSKVIGNKKRRFVLNWFNEFDWLEYSVKENKAYCLYCYLCGDIVGQRGGRDAFVIEGFDTWSKKEAFRIHMGNIDSLHNKARQECENILKERQSISVAFRKQTELEDSNYKLLLRSSCSVARYLLKNAQPFCGHDESVDSLSRGIHMGNIDSLHNKARNKIGDDFMNDVLICNVEKEALLKVNIEDVMVRFQNMSVRRGQL